jgi:hypothetical protein
VSDLLASFTLANKGEKFLGIVFNQLRLCWFPLLEYHRKKH